MDNPEITTDKNSVTAHFVSARKRRRREDSATWKMCWAIIGFLPLEPAG